MMGPEWKYCINLDRDDWDDIQTWCMKYIGEFDQSWYKLGIDPADYIVNGNRRTTWFFKREVDAIMFALKWR